MKRISIVCLTGLLFFTACENTGSSTVGSYERDETSQSSEKTEAHEAQVKEGSTTDTLKASVNTNEGIEIKTDTTVSADTTAKP